MSQGFQYYIIFTNQLLIYPKFISNITNIIERKSHKFNTLHLKCFPGNSWKTWFSWNFHVSRARFYFFLIFRIFTQIQTFSIVKKRQVPVFMRPSNYLSNSHADVPRGVGGGWGGGGGGGGRGGGGEGGRGGGRGAQRSTGRNHSCTLLAPPILSFRRLSNSKRRVSLQLCTRLSLLLLLVIPILN